MCKARFKAKETQAWRAKQEIPLGSSFFKKHTHLRNQSHLSTRTGPTRFDPGLSIALLLFLSIVARAAAEQTKTVALNKKTLDQTLKEKMVFSADLTKQQIDDCESLGEWIVDTSKFDKPSTSYIATVLSHPAFKLNCTTSEIGIKTDKDFRMMHVPHYVQQYDGYRKYETINGLFNEAKCGLVVHHSKLCEPGNMQYTLAANAVVTLTDLEAYLAAIDLGNSRVNGIMTFSDNLPTDDVQFEYQAYKSAIEDTEQEKLDPLTPECIIGAMQPTGGTFTVNLDKLATLLFSVLDADYKTLRGMPRSLLQTTHAEAYQSREAMHEVYRNKRHTLKLRGSLWKFDDITKRVKTALVHRESITIEKCDERIGMMFVDAGFKRR